MPFEVGEGGSSRLKKKQRGWRSMLGLENNNAAVSFVSVLTEVIATIRR